MSVLDKFRFPYPSGQQDGFWGHQTSTLNFCEEDYVLSYYCAELINTTSNALFLWLGIRGLRNCIRDRHDVVFSIAYVGYLIVGLGSVLFHATLKYPMQLIDELSMIYTTCVMLYASLAHSKSRMYSIVLGMILLATSAFITIYYHMTQNPVFHQVAYAILTATVVFRGLWVMEYRLRPALEARHRHGYQSCSSSSRTGTTTQSVMRRMWVLVGVGISVFVGGFAIWNLDNIFCSQVRRARRMIGLPWAIGLEGHGWWHLMSGVGAYYYITWGIWLRLCLEGREDEYDVHWPSVLTSLPEVRAVEEEMTTTNGKVNGGEKMNGNGNGIGHKRRRGGKTGGRVSSVSLLVKK